MKNGPVIMGAADERLVGVKGGSSRRPANLDQLGLPEETAGLVLMNADTAIRGKAFKGIPDDNRSAILPEVVAEIGHRGYAFCAKGVGARTPLYGESPLDFAFHLDFGPSAHKASKRSLAGARLITSESWFGEAPYGAQGEIPATQGLMITELAKGTSIEGFHICPIVEVVELPSEIAGKAEDLYWYRRHKGPMLQEHRLMPSNVRLYHQSTMTLGQNPREVLDAFGAHTPDALDSFIDSYISSGVAALTLFARTAKKCPWGIQGLDYQHVWLDKDCVVAPDGTLHFADLEGLDWILAGQDKSVEERVREQFNRNYYEFMYGLDVLSRETERLKGRRGSQDERRRSLSYRFELALGRDRHLKCESSRSALDIILGSVPGADESIAIRVIDLR